MGDRRRYPTRESARRIGTSRAFVDCVNLSADQFERQRGQSVVFASAQRYSIATFSLEALVKRPPVVGLLRNTPSASFEHTVAALRRGHCLRCQ